MRTLYVAGSIYVVFSALVLFTPVLRSNPVGHGGSVPPAHSGPAGDWFRTIKPYCNTVEVETVHSRMPPPETLAGAGYSAACFALAGKIVRAREIIMEVPAADRYRAAGIVFGVAHPVADAGDDKSAGPIMELVVEFWPNHYMALYHAGMSNYMLGNPEKARDYLRNFLRHYDQNDGWTRNARTVLQRIEDR